MSNVVLEENLDAEDTIETLEQIITIANALQDSQDAVMKRTAKIAMKILRGTAAALPPNATMVNLCNQLPSLITKIF